MRLGLFGVLLPDLDDLVWGACLWVLFDYLILVRECIVGMGDRRDPVE